MRIGRIACLALGLGTPALAQEACPTAADLDRGIRVVNQDGTTEIFRRGDRPGVLDMQGTDPTGEPYRVQLGQGVHVLSFEMTSDKSTRTAYDYGMVPADMPVPRPGGRWNVPVTMRTATGPQAMEQLQAWGQEGPVRIGPCRYDAIEVVIAYAQADQPGAPYTEGLRYFPALGLAVLAWQLWDGQPRTENVQLSIRAEP